MEKEEERRWGVKVQEGRWGAGKAREFVWSIHGAGGQLGVRGRANGGGWASPGALLLHLGLHSGGWAEGGALPAGLRSLHSAPSPATGACTPRHAHQQACTLHPSCTPHLLQNELPLLVFLALLVRHLHSSAGRSWQHNARQSFRLELLRTAQRLAAPSCRAGSQVWPRAAQLQPCSPHLVLPAQHAVAGDAVDVAHRVQARDQHAVLARPQRHIHAARAGVQQQGQGRSARREQLGPDRCTQLGSKAEGGLATRPRRGALHSHVAEQVGAAMPPLERLRAASRQAMELMGAPIEPRRSHQAGQGSNLAMAGRCAIWERRRRPTAALRACAPPHLANELPVVCAVRLALRARVNLVAREVLRSGQSGGWRGYGVDSHRIGRAAAGG